MPMRRPRCGRRSNTHRCVLPVARVSRRRHSIRSPDVRGGNARVEGSSIGVHDVIGLIVNGASVDEVCRSFPDLKRSHVYKCLAYYEDHRAEIDDLVAGPNLQVYGPGDTNGGIYPASGDIFIDADGIGAGNIIRNIDLRPLQENAVTISSTSVKACVGIPFQGAVRDTPGGAAPRYQVIEVAGSAADQSIQVNNPCNCPIPSYPNTDEMGC